MVVIAAARRSPEPAPAGLPSAWGVRNAHDPTVVRDTDGTWYMFSTDAAAGAADVATGVQVRHSVDLVNWTWLGTALDGVPRPAFEWTGAAGLWAPEVVRWPSADGDRWHMYYSASTFGSTTSVIGLAVASALSGPWYDRGIVVATREGETTQNAIDAAVTRDRHGVPWLTYGSFFSGIYALPLDPHTGFARMAGDLGIRIARRAASVEGAIEGAFVLYRREEDHFVLFASYDSLFGSYHVRVAVAADISGPYHDYLGHSMTNVDAEPSSVGTKVLGSYSFDADTAWLAPGHNSILVEASSGMSPGDEYFMVHHVRFAADPAQHIAHLRRTFFTGGGWPVVSPQPFAGRDSETIEPPQALEGPWRAVRHEPASTEPVAASKVTVAEVADVGDGVSLPREFDGRAQSVRLVVAGTEIDAVVFGSWDWARGAAALSFSGISDDGIAWFGTKGA